MENISILRSDAPIIGISEIIKSKNYDFEYKVLDLSVQESNRIVSEYLNIPLATKVLSYKKLRVINSIPCSIEKIYIEYEKVKGLEGENLTNIPLSDKLKELYNYEVTRTDEDIRVVKANEEETNMLDLKGDSYVALTTGVSYLKDNSILEYFQIISRYNFFKYRSVEIYE